MSSHNVAGSAMHAHASLCGQHGLYTALVRAHALTRERLRLVQQAFAPARIPCHVRALRSHTSDTDIEKAP